MAIVTKILDTYPTLTLIIGSAEKSGTEENPWSYPERLSIIAESMPEEILSRITFYPLSDVPDDDTWCQNLKKIIPHNSILFTGNEWVRDICTCQAIEVDWIIPTIDISATKIREMIRNGENVSEWAKV